jgi:hypothetical protein
MKKTVLAVVLSVGLVACGKEGGGAGANSGSDGGSSAGTSEKISREATQSQERQLVASFKTDATPFILETIMYGVDRGTLAKGVIQYLIEPEKNDVLFEPTGGGAAAYVEGWKNIEKQYPESFKQVKEAAKTNPLAAYQLTILNDEAKLRGAFIKELSRGYIIAAVQPFNGWRVDPINGPKNLTANYINGLTGVGLYANEVLTELAEPLKSRVFKDEDEARFAIRKKWAEMDIEKMKALWMGKYRHIAPTGTVLDTASGHGVNWTNSVGAFKCDENGMVILRNGQPYFGQGYLSGQKVELLLANSGKSGMSKSKSIEQSVGAEQRSGSGASASPN